MMPDNIIVGDYQTGIDLPEATQENTSLNEEKKLAKFSRTAEFKRQKEYIDERIIFYQSFLPNGAEVGLDVQPTSEDWRVANRVIGEFKAFLSQYDMAAEAVKEEKSA